MGIGFKIDFVIKKPGTGDGAEGRLDATAGDGSLDIMAKPSRETSRREPAVLEPFSERRWADREWSESRAGFPGATKEREGGHGRCEMTAPTGAG